MSPGRTIVTDLKGIARSAFSVLPLTRAHMTRPRSELSAPPPDTNTKASRGLFATSREAIDSVRSWVTRAYSACSYLTA